MTSEPEAPHAFITQGPVPPSSSLLVGRQEEIGTLLRWLRDLSRYGAVMGARQTGKTSLLLRFRDVCGAGGAACVYVNLQAIEGADAAACYEHIAGEIAEQAYRDTARALALPKSSTGLLTFLREAARTVREGRIAVMLDEVGALPPETARRLAKTVRTVFTDRFIKPEYEHYFFVFAGAADMLELTEDKQTSPLSNVTESIYLKDLSLEEVADLLQRGCTGLDSTVLESMARCIRDWTGGHPYWTQLLARACTACGACDALSVRAAVEDVLEREDRNLPHVFSALEHAPAAVRGRAIDILRGTAVNFWRSDPVVARLELIGIIRDEDRRCVIRNRIYDAALRRYFGISEIALPPAAGPAATRDDAIRILHLSDLHIGTAEDARTYRTHLLMDLRQDMDVPFVDYLVISGDVADTAIPGEYAAAVDLISGIAAELGVASERIVSVPGNHDVNWNISAKSYKIIPRFKVRMLPPPGEYIDAGAAGIQVPDKRRYRKRFEHFSCEFHKRLYAGAAYPEDYEEQGTITLSPEHRILFLGLNSCWNLDHHYAGRASIHPASLSRALDKIAGETYRGWLKIAVWHHPVTGEAAMNDEFLQLLSVHGFAIGMHGHIHEAIEQFHRYDNRRGVRIIGAGTFGAPANQLVPGIPLQYNLLVLDPAKRVLRVNTRKKEKRFGAWSADARWGDKNDPKPWYEIPLAGRWEPVIKPANGARSLG